MEQDTNQEGEEDTVGGVSQLCRVCHRGRKGHDCPGVYQPVRQTIVTDLRRGKNPTNNTPLFGVVTRRRGQEEPVIKGVFAPYDQREMKGDFESMEQFVLRTTGRVATAEDWNYNCSVCDRSGSVMMCQGCNLVYHERCIVTKTLADGLMRNQEFLCPDCVQSLEAVVE